MPDNKKSDRVSVSLNPLVGNTLTALCTEEGVPRTRVVDETIDRLNKGKPVKSIREIVLYIKGQIKAEKADTTKDHSDAKRLRDKGWVCTPPTKVSLEGFMSEKSELSNQ